MKHCIVGFLILNSVLRTHMTQYKRGIGFLMTSFLFCFTDLDHSRGTRSESRHFLLALVLKLVLEYFSVASDTERSTALVTYKP